MDMTPKASGIDSFRLAVLFVLLSQTISSANPVVDPISGLGPVMILGSLFVLEASIIVISLLFFGMSPNPLFFVILFGNATIYFGIFRPLYEMLENLLIAELIIVFMDAGFIKLLAGLDFFQLDSFRGIGWKAAVLVSIAGNAISYYVGTIIL